MPKYKSCSICLNRRCVHMHCKVCKGNDKMVCNGCIRRMMRLEQGHNRPIFFYDCPHCRTKKTIPKRMKYCKRTRNRVGDLIIEDIERMIREIQAYRENRRREISI